MECPRSFPPNVVREAEGKGKQSQASYVHRISSDIFCILFGSCSGQQVALLAVASYVVVLEDARPAAWLAVASFAFVLADF